MQTIAHIRKSDKAIQTIEEHLLGVKNIAESIGEKINIKHLCGLAGLLHDVGKFKNEFREYILEAVNNPDHPPKRGSVDHSTAGAKLLYDKFHLGKDKYHGLVAEIVGNAIMSHHSYLQDFISPELESDYLRRARDKQENDFDDTIFQFYNKVMSEENFKKYVETASRELMKYMEDLNPRHFEKEWMFLTKYIFSALVDADRTNTRLFEENKNEVNQLDINNLFRKYYKKLISHLNKLQNTKQASTKINQLRNEMSEQCDTFADQPSGIYTLSIPTGGGKTLASLRYALKHAQRYNKKRIIYVVPFTTIIEQNAKTIKDILEDDVNILEHHSNVTDFESDSENLDEYMKKSYKLKLAKDNWDSPIVLTTMVQFLNVFFAKGNRYTRRLHNLSNAIIIFDEVQKVPIKCVSLFNMALNFLKNKCSSSILLCTATQPALDYVENKLEINADAEIINHLDNVVETFKRVEIINNATNIEMSTDGLSNFVIDKFEEVNSILVILNTKKVVKDLFNMLNDRIDDVNIYHLSTAMCAAHRNYILNEVRKNLRNGKKVICISTQLIEAGVDISFECVIRSMAGLDSIAQAAGRCNRNGESDTRNVYVIDHKEENLDKLKEIKKGKKITKNILIDLERDSNSHGGNVLSSDAMNRYFREFYNDFRMGLNYPINNYSNIVDLLTKPKGESAIFTEYCSKHGKRPQMFIVNSYNTAAKHFRVIENNTKSVLVPYKAGKDLIASLNGFSGIGEYENFFKEIQHYTVNIYQHEYDKLIENNSVVSYLDGQVIALTEDAYNDMYGLDTEGNGSKGLLFM